MAPPQPQKQLSECCKAEIRLEALGNPNTTLEFCTNCRRSISGMIADGVYYPESPKPSQPDEELEKKVKEVFPDSQTLADEEKKCTCDEAAYGDLRCPIHPDLSSLEKTKSSQPDEEKKLPCPHGRPHWSSCPHCLGINSIMQSDLSSLEKPKESDEEYYACWNKDCPKYGKKGHYHSIGREAYQSSEESDEEVLEKLRDELFVRGNHMDWDFGAREDELIDYIYKICKAVESKTLKEIQENQIKWYETYTQSLQKEIVDLKAENKKLKADTQSSFLNDQNS